MFDFKNITNFFAKHFTKRDVLIIGVLLICYFATRLIRLDQWPIFSDEGIYIRWAKVAWHDATWRFISLTDGKQPLQTWGTIPFLKFFPNNALLGGRLFSVATGFAALAGMFTLLFSLFGKRAALLGTTLYVFTPYFLFYDRMALVDSGVNAGFIWILFFSIYLARTIRLDVALLFGLTAGMSLLAKSSVRIFMMLSALAPILFYEKNIKKFVQRSINYYLLFLIAAVLGLVIYNVQRLSPFFHYVDEKNYTFIMTFSEFLHNPFAVLTHNLTTVPLYVFWELGWVVVPFAFLGIWKLFFSDRRLSLYFLTWIILPYIVISAFSKVLFPRYIIFFGSLFVILGTYYLSQLKNKKLQFGLFTILIISQLFFDYSILFNPATASLPPIDRGQYVTGPSAVWGAKELVQYARDKSVDKPVLLLAEGNFGLVADVLDVFIKPTDRIYIQGAWPLDEKVLLETMKELKDKHVFIVFSHREEFPTNWPIKLIKKYPKPGHDKALYLFEYTTEKLDK